MKFLEELNALSVESKCKVQRWFDSLDSDYVGEIKDAMAEGFPSKTIWRVIVNREGMIFSESVFARHRKGECGCGIQR